MDLVIQGPRIYARAICAPANRGDRAAKLVHAHGVFRALVAALPYANGAVIAAGDYELDPCASCESPIEGINDTTVSVEFTHTLAGGEVRNGEGVVRRSGVHQLRRERPLEVEDGSFVNIGGEAIVGVRGIGPPEGCRETRE